MVYLFELKWLPTFSQLLGFCLNCYVSWASHTFLYLKTKTWVLSCSGNGLGPRKPVFQVETLFKYLLNPTTMVVVRIGVLGLFARQFGQQKMIMGLGIERLLLTLLQIGITKLGPEVNRGIRNWETPNHDIVVRRRLGRCFSKPNCAANSELRLAFISPTAILLIALKSFEDRLPIG